MACSQSPAPNGYSLLSFASPCHLQNGVHVVDSNDRTGTGDTFLAYSSKLGEAFITDLLQGYLPAEFQACGCQSKVARVGHRAWITWTPTSVYNIPGGIPGTTNSRSGAVAGLGVSCAPTWVCTMARLWRRVFLDPALCPQTCHQEGRGRGSLPGSFRESSPF